ncbi:MAG: RecQ family ATP-dependent DNA helicase [Flavobacteriales bacterium]|nr:RecQ family ATP-dependent DNA helicase [Flavobacteriales bacterium]
MLTKGGNSPLSINEILKKYWGHSGFRPKQEEIIHAVMAGNDTLALLPTGGGKSVCFQVPALAMGKLCLVVSPLIALMKDQVERLQKAGVAARAITSGMSYSEMENVLESAAFGKLSFLYVSPERLGSELFEARLPRLPLGLIAIDEAHCISQWGYDFRPAYLKIQLVRERVPNIPVLALTASATITVANDIMDKLAFRGRNMVRGSFLRPELVLWTSQGDDKHGRLLRVMQKVDGSSIVYLRTRKGTVRTARFLQHHGISAEAYHAGLTSNERDRIQKEWTSGTLRCVVATNAFGMGIDKPDVRAVVHMELPPDMESFYQEAGRGGRDGNMAYAFLIVGPGDDENLRDRAQAAFPEHTDVRRVYQAFADINAIAHGSGELETYDLDIAALSARTSLPPTVVHHSLKALELDGRIVLSEGVRSPSRVFIRATHKVIYDLRVANEKHGPVLEALLRLYGGLYEESAVVDEARIAKLIGSEARNVSAMLKELDQQKVITYKPRNDAPALTLLTPRVDSDRLRLEPAALELRKQRAMDRLDAMLAYVKNSKTCRVRVLLSYFDEPDLKDCGQCDVCRSVAGYITRSATSAVNEPLNEFDVPDREKRWSNDEFEKPRTKDQ